MSKRAAAAFLAPFLILFAAFFVAPMLYAFAQSLTRVERAGLLGLRGSTTEFAGLANYGAALSDGDYIGSIGRILLFAVIIVPLMVVLSTALALVLEAGLARWPRFFRTAFFLPYGIPGVIASIMWGFLYAPGTSPFTPVFTSLGAEVDLLGPGTVFWSIMNIVLWQFVGYNVLIVVAQLQSIPRVLYEAARIDGAGRWTIARNVQLPLIRPALVLVTVFTIIGSLQLFNEPFVLQPLSGGISSTYTPTLTAYKEAFNSNNLSLAAAESIILAVVISVLSFGFLRLVQRGRR